MNLFFKEVQKFNKWWHYLFMLLPFIFSTALSYLIINNIIETNDGQKHPILLFIIILLSVLGGLWFYRMKLITTINQDGIEVNYQAIPFAKRKILWTDIEKIEVITYSPFWEYGGWGVRWSPNGWCYNVRGKHGIKITYHNKDIFLIGTQAPEKMQQIINNYFN